MSTELLQQVVLIVHLLLALSITGLIMIQQGKGAEMGASFGAGASQTLFGSSGSGNVLTRATAWLVALFFATSFGLAVLAKERTASQDSLGIQLPPAIEADADPQDSGDLSGAEAIIDDLPMVEDDEPVMTSGEMGVGDLPDTGDIPEIEE